MTAAPPSLTPDTIERSALLFEGERVVAMASTTEPPAGTSRDVAEVADELAALELSLYVRLDGAAERAREFEARARADGQLDVATRAELIRSDAWSRHGLLAEARELQERILATTRGTGRPQLESRSQCLLASTYSRLALWPESQAAASESVRLLDRSSPAHWQVEHYLVLATYATFDRAGSGSFELFEECLGRARALGNETLLLVVLNNFVWNAKSVPTHQARAYGLAEELSERVRGHPELVTVPILDTLAVVRLEQGRLTEAEELLGAAFAHTYRVEPDEFAALTAHLADIRRREGRLGEARELLERARASAIGAQTPEIGIGALRKLAEIDAATGDFRRAYRRLKRYIAEQESAGRAESEKRGALLQSVYETELERDRGRRYQELALRDPLTNLYNRRYLDERLGKLLDLGVVSAAMIDVDYFKQINDHHSHEVGDEVLRQLAALLRRHVRSLTVGGVVIRLGGEEFLSIAPGIDAPVAVEAFERLRVDVAVTVWAGLPAAVQPTISIGLVTSTGPTVTSAEMLSRADQLLYQAKRAGRNRLVSGLSSDPPLDPARGRRR